MATYTKGDMAGSGTVSTQAFTNGDTYTVNITPLQNINIGQVYFTMSTPKFDSTIPSYFTGTTFTNPAASDITITPSMITLDNNGYHWAFVVPNYGLTVPDTAADAYLNDITTSPLNMINGAYASVALTTVSGDGIGIVADFLVAGLAITEVNITRGYNASAGDVYEIPAGALGATSSKGEITIPNNNNFSQVSTSLSFTPAIDIPTGAVIIQGTGDIGCEIT